MKRSAVLVCPGRGSYGPGDLGAITAKASKDGQDIIQHLDDRRRALGQITLSDLDKKNRFSLKTHTSSANASSLIFASSLLDFLSIDNNEYEIVAVTGNSLGWYTAITCASAVSLMEGFNIVNTMGTLMESKGRGGQLVYPWMSAGWEVAFERREQIMQWVKEIDCEADAFLRLSIDFGGMLVFAGNEIGLKKFETLAPKIADKFPVRLKNHAAFHTSMLSHIAVEASELFGESLFTSSEIPMVDGRGAIWYPRCYDPHALHDYTLRHQIIEPYFFSKAIQVAAMEFAPDVFVTVGPGDSLRKAIAESLIMINWKDIGCREEFENKEKKEPIIISSGESSER
jgi:[acyl-carrier-protein] S-malonyltransferase